MSHASLNDLAQTIIDSNRYMVLGTADQAGHPLVTPVWFSSQDYTRFHWVSSPGPLSVSPTARGRETDTSETPRTRSGRLATQRLSPEPVDLQKGASRVIARV